MLLRLGLMSPDALLAPPAFGLVPEDFFLEFGELDGDAGAGAAPGPEPEPGAGAAPGAGAGPGAGTGAGPLDSSGDELMTPPSKVAMGSWLTVMVVSMGAGGCAGGCAGGSAGGCSAGCSAGCSGGGGGASKTVGVGGGAASTGAGAVSLASRLWIPTWFGIHGL